jgi:hypothetical protein
VSRINTQHRHGRGKEFQFFERKANTAPVRMAFDIRIELRRVERAVQLVALQLRHVHTVGGEAAQCLVERRGHVSHTENKSGHDRPGIRRRIVRLGCHDQEARHVVRRVFHIRPQHLQTIDFCRER